MAPQSTALRKDKVKTKQAPEKVRLLASRAPFLRPKVIAFPLDGMTVEGPLAMAGNV